MNVPFLVDQIAYAKFKKAWDLNELDKLMCGEDGYLHYASREMAEWRAPQDCEAMLRRGFITHWQITGKSDEVPRRFVSALEAVMCKTDIALAANVIRNWLFWYFYSKSEQAKDPANPASAVFPADFNKINEKLTIWFDQHQDILKQDKKHAGSHANSWLANEVVMRRIHELGGPDVLKRN